MDKKRRNMILISVITIVTLGLCFLSTGMGEWFPPGGSVVP